MRVVVVEAGVRFSLMARVVCLLDHHFQGFKLFSLYAVLLSAASRQ